MHTTIRLHRWSTVAVLGHLLAITGCGLEAAEPEVAATDQAIGANSASFQDGVQPSTSYAGTRDTMIEQNAPTATHGADNRLSVSGDTPSGSSKDESVLLQWDISATMPTSAIVRSATLTFQISDKSSQSFAIYEALRTWDETTATWNQASSGNGWATAGAQGAADRGSSSLGTLSASSTGSYTITLNAAGLAAVQRWVSDPTTNHGVIIASTSNDNRIELRSSELSTKSQRPKLTVTWDQAAGSGLVQTPGTYKKTCDGSAAISLDGSHFLDINDETQVLNIYTQGANANPVQSLDIGSAIGLSSSDEADLEGAARIGNRVYVISSHGRDKNGNLESMRYKFFAIDLAGSVPSLSVTVAGTYNKLLVDMLDAANWVTPNTSVISALQSSSQLSQPSVPNLAPKDQGTNIEALGALPSGSLVIGIRNPQLSTSAIAVTLLNPNAVIAGAKAQFGEAIVMNLGGNGIRDISWSAAHGAAFLLSGPHDASDGPYALWKWSGAPTSAPVKVMDLTAPANSAPEAVVPYAGTTDLQVLFDMGSVQIGGNDCKTVSTSSQYFTDTILHVN